MHRDALLTKSVTVNFRREFRRSTTSESTKRFHRMEPQRVVDSGLYLWSVTRFTGSSLE